VSTLSDTTTIANVLNTDNVVAGPIVFLQLNSICFAMSLTEPRENGRRSGGRIPFLV
jgi:hypothetical protein